MELRGQSISYTSYKIEQRNIKEKELTNKLTILKSSINEKNSGELDKLKTELCEIRQEKLK